MFKQSVVVLASVTLFGCGLLAGQRTAQERPTPTTMSDHFDPDALMREDHRRDRTSREPEAPAAPAPAAPAAIPPPPPATASPQAPPAAAAPQAVPPGAAAPPPVSELMFNDAIRRAVAAGDIDRGLRLLEEAERLGSTSARAAFIEAVEQRRE